MNPLVSSALSRARRTLDGFTTGQRVITALALVGLLIGGVVFSRWASTPSYAPMFSNLSASDASAITAKLAADKKPYKLADGGATILVPQSTVYQSRLDMSAANLPAGGNGGGYSLLDKSGITSSDFQQKVQYKRAMEGELSNTLMAMDGVTAAVVHLAIPEQSVFATDTAKPSASVLVKTAPGATLTSSQVQAVVHLVSASVPGLDASAVTVADGTGRVLSTAGQSGMAGSADDATVAYEHRITSSLQDMVDLVVGPGHAVVKASADLDFDASATKTESYLQPSPSAIPLSEARTTEKYSGSGGMAAGVLGPDNNAVPNGGAAPAASPNTYAKEQVTVENSVGRVTAEVQKAPGSVRRLSVAVLLDAKAARSVDIAKLQASVVDAAGLVKTRGDTVTVAALPFDASAADAAKKELAAQEKARKAAQTRSLERTGGLVLLAVLVLLVLWRKGRKAAAQQPLTASQLHELEQARRALAAREATALPAATERPALEAAVDEDLERRLAIQSDIGDMVDSQPDEVAQLLRGWLADKGS